MKKTYNFGIIPKHLIMYNLSSSKIVKNSCLLFIDSLLSTIIKYNVFYCFIVLSKHIAAYICRRCVIWMYLFSEIKYYCVLLSLSIKTIILGIIFYHCLKPFFYLRPNCSYIPQTNSKTCIKKNKNIKKKKSTPFFYLIALRKQRHSNYKTVSKLTTHEKQQTEEFLRKKEKEGGNMPRRSEIWGFIFCLHRQRIFMSKLWAIWV